MANDIITHPSIDDGIRMLTSLWMGLGYNFGIGISFTSCHFDKPVYPVTGIGTSTESAGIRQPGISAEATRDGQRS